MQEKIRKADKDFWSFIPETQLWEAIILSLDIEPRSIKLWIPTWDPVTVERRSNIFKVKKVSDRFEIAKAHLEASKLKSASRLVGKPEEWKVILVDFIKWAKSLNWELPEWFSQLVGEQNSNKVIRNDERRSLHIIIAALAKEAKIDINTPDAAAEIIMALANTCGMEIGKTTIRDHLKRVANTYALEAYGN